ncbi:hypothetical protein HPB50_011396 [Hyalomma asiaticum]|uniref:Uncharacterized protein n=2 Tax=Hyalomma asiaticum TaxID=266040 RepID=A0ACB7S895_HYAAI|nr:hypothetical protein HPB50_028609 [Hyalomma asiaticum]KAH6926036.1 hypothetical protein HPB50_013031 [Hyalomma asiaticum]KAH6930171.1 hypothetical protein HPB50_011396 [Hyalomma asiaticum]
MSLSKTAPCGDEDLDQLFLVLATQQTALRQTELQILRLQEELEALDDDITNEERRCRVLAATAARLCFRERDVWSYLRAQSCEPLGVDVRNALAKHLAASGTTSAV